MKQHAGARSTVLVSLCILASSLAFLTIALAVLTGLGIVATLAVTLTR